MGPILHLVLSLVTTMPPASLTIYQNSGPSINFQLGNFSPTDRLVLLQTRGCPCGFGVTRW